MDKDILKKQVYEALKEIKIDPEKIIRIPLFPAMLEKFMKGEWTKKQFQDNCFKLTIFNPQIRKI